MQDKKGKGLLLEDETLRDGLQIESQLFTIEQKMEFFSLLAGSGVRRIQVGSFVNPKIVPQMADTDQLISLLGQQKNTVVSALILNSRGLDRALASGISHVSMSVSVSDSHSRKNANRSSADALITMVELIRNARSNGLQVRAGLQSAFGCVYDGAIAETTVLHAAEKMVEAGANEINVADSTGMANPLSIKSMINRVREVLPGVDLSLHLHDTRGMGMTNMLAGYEAGVRTFDVCTGGLGGCPFIKGAAGNIPTEDAVHMFESMNIPTGIDLVEVVEAVRFLEKILGRPLPGKMRHVSDYQQAR